VRIEWLLVVEVLLATTEHGLQPSPVTGGRSGSFYLYLDHRSAPARGITFKPELSQRRRRGVEFWRENRVATGTLRFAFMKRFPVFGEEKQGKK
jgi:hypothetical protein